MDNEPETTEAPEIPERPPRLPHWVNCKNCGAAVEVPHRARAPDTCENCPK